MSYANLVAQVVTSTAESFQHFRDFICKRAGTYDYSATGIGWTLHDAVYAVDEDTLTAGDYIVVYSSGEDGTHDMYYKIVYSSTTTIAVTGYLYWDNSTHTGSTKYFGTAIASSIAAASNMLYVYGDLDFVSFVNKNSSGTYYITFVGKLETLHYDDTVVTCSSDLSSGSGIVIPVSSVPDSWAVGEKIMIKDRTNMQQATITDITGTDVTVASLSTAFVASQGIKLAQYFPYVAPNSTTAWTSAPYIIMNLAGVSNQIIYASSTCLDGSHVFSPYNSLDAEASILTYIYYGKVSNILRMLQLVLTNDTVYTNDGNNYRALYMSGNAARLLFREV